MCKAYNLHTPTNQNKLKNEKMLKKSIGKIICFFKRKHKYVIKEEFKRIGTNEYYKIYICERCGKIKHVISKTINP